MPDVIVSVDLAGTSFYRLLRLREYVVGAVDFWELMVGENASNTVVEKASLGRVI